MPPLSGVAYELQCMAVGRAKPYPCHTFSMIHHLVLFKLKPDASSQALEELMRQSRMHLLKISEVRSIRCGKHVEPENEWSFFFSIEVESMRKLHAIFCNPVYKKYVAEAVRPLVSRQVTLNYESDPGKNVRYS